MCISTTQKENIYSNYYGKVYGYIRHKVNNRQDAEDIVADVFYKVYKTLDTFDTSKSSLSTWIYNITKNTLTDYFRTRRVFFQILPTQSDGTSVENDLCNAETLETLANALDTLDERQRDIIIQRYYFGKTMIEITSRMGISYAYGKVLQKRALNEIKKYFEKQ